MGSENRYYGKQNTERLPIRRTEARRMQSSRRSESRGQRQYSTERSAQQQRRRPQSAAARRAREERRRKLIWKRRILIAVMLVLFAALVIGVIAIVKGISGRSKEKAAEQAAMEAAGQEMTARLDQAADAATQLAEMPVLKSEDIVWPENLPDEVKTGLLERSRTDKDVHWILENSDLYVENGEAIHRKIFRLLNKESEAVSYVRNYPDKYPDETVRPCDSAELTDGVPHLYQWDERWGYMTYSSTAFGMTGCGPTAFSMAAIALTGNPDYSPGYVGQYCKDHGYMSEEEGTYNSFFVEAAPDFGISSTDEVPLSADELTAALQDGSLVVCHIGPGDFTQTGHYILFTGVADDGTLIVNDPYSVVNSGKTWSVDLIEEQAIGFYIINNGE